MSYFKNYPTINYRFGDETTSTQFQDIGAYIDLIDRVKDDISYYEEYNLRDGDRPDQFLIISMVPQIIIGHSICLMMN